MSCRDRTLCLSSPGSKFALTRRNHMTMIVGSKVLGVLTESQQLDQAIDELQRSGFNNIDFAHPGETASSFNARSGLTGFIRAVFSPNEGDIRVILSPTLPKSAYRMRKPVITSANSSLAAASLSSMLPVARNRLLPSCANTEHLIRRPVLQTDDTPRG